MSKVLESPQDGDQHKTEESTNNGVCVEFATLPPNAYIDIFGMARMLKRSTKSVQRAVRRGDLPAPFKFLGKLTWLAGSVVEHMKVRQEAVLQLAAQLQSRRLKHSS